MQGKGRVSAIIDRSDKLWFQHMLNKAVAEGWCMQMNCTTCGALEFRGTLGLIERDAKGYVRRCALGLAEAMEIIAALRHCSKPKAEWQQFEAGIMLTLYELWCIFGDTAHEQLFPGLQGSWAEEILNRMQAHFQQRLEARRIHDARQSVKRRNWIV